MYCDMTPERRNNRLLENGSLKYLSVTKNRHAIIHELLEVVISVRFAPRLKVGHVTDSRVHS
jgi:hypothetical protein